MPNKTTRHSFRGEHYAIPSQRRLTRDEASVMGPRPEELETPRALAGMVKGALGIDQRTRDDTAVASREEPDWPGSTRRVVARLGDEVRGPNCYLAKDPNTQEWCVVEDRTERDPSMSLRQAGGEG